MLIFFSLSQPDGLQWVKIHYEQVSTAMLCAMRERKGGLCLTWRQHLCPPPMQPLWTASHTLCVLNTCAIRQHSFPLWRRHKTELHHLAFDTGVKESNNTISWAEENKADTIILFVWVTTGESRTATRGHKCVWKSTHTHRLTAQSTSTQPLNIITCSQLTREWWQDLSVFYKWSSYTMPTWEEQSQC